MLLALPMGLLIGLSLGALGGGGSILTVPALVYVLGVSPHSSTLASLIIVGITSLAGMGAHWRAGRVQVRAGIIFGVLGVGGAYAGSRLSDSISPDVLLAAFSVLMVGAAAMMMRRKRTRPDADDARAAQETGQQAAAAGPAGDADMPGPAGDRPEGAVAVRHAPPLTPVRAPERRPVSPVRMVVAATVVGLVTGFFGVGGGFVVVPALVLALGFDMPTAVGTSLLVIAINSASAVVSRLGTHVALAPGLLVTFTAAAIVGSVAGSRIASRIRPERLVTAFALLVLGIACYTAARSFPSLL